MIHLLHCTNVHGTVQSSRHVISRPKNKSKTDLIVRQKGGCYGLVTVENQCYALVIRLVAKINQSQYAKLASARKDNRAISVFLFCAIVSSLDPYYKSV